ncbi:YbaB/EbfC family nucleoid-associated protein [Paractinoplanes rishiriensis]|nr:YbaB/EbfC family nucleoid-associated protein [Actinoplanes rishiriensis]
MSLYGYANTDREGPEERLARIASSARSISRVLRSATRSGVRHQGSDGTGLVTMSADGSGRVESIHIDPSWFQRHTATALGPAMFEAYQAVMTEVMTASVEQMEEAEREEAQRPPDEPAPDAYTGRPQDFHAPTFDDVRAALRDLEERQYIREYQRQRRASGQGEEQTVYGPYRLAAVTVRGGDVAEITIPTPVGRDRVNVLAQDTVRALQMVRAGETEA